ncbi:MAG: hypothetical protein LAO56_00185 [Acidobacteriia bacterium]|nr:hypothetical protein [Terriglobia bacterium]
MTAESESMFLEAHRNALNCFWDQVKSHVIEWKSGYEWGGVRGQAALEERNKIERKIRMDLAGQRCLSKATFDSVMNWGFKRDSECSEEEINRATHFAFQRLEEDRLGEAARELVKLRNVGISRATKVLALSDQNELGIYDSRSADGLSDLVNSAGRHLIPIPPSRSKKIKGDHKTKEEYCAAFESYTWVLRYLRRLAGNDDSLRAAFTRIADLEIAFFMRKRLGDPRRYSHE